MEGGGGGGGYGGEGERGRGGGEVEMEGGRRGRMWGEGGGDGFDWLVGVRLGTL